MLDALLGEGFEVVVFDEWVGLEGVVFEDVFEGPGGIEAEVYADVAVLFEAGVVEVGAEAEDADGGGAELPERVELDAGVV